MHLLEVAEEYVVPEYLRIGSTLRGNKTETTRRCAVVYFEDYLTSKQWSWNESLLCRKETFQEFAGFLFDVTVRRRTDDSKLSISTVTTYLSAVKEHVREKWPGNSVWNGHDSAKVAGKNRVTGGWFTQINFDLETKQNNRCIEQGDSINERTQPMGREATAACVEFLLGSNTPVGVLRAALMAVTLSAVGRAGEVGYASWKQTNYNSVDKALYIDWNEHKTHKQSVVNFFPDKFDYRLDVFFLLSLYFINGGGKHVLKSPLYVKEMANRKANDAKLIFPEVAVNATAAIADAVAFCKGKVALLPSNGKFTGKSLRCGGLQEVIIRTGNKAAGIFRGGWWNFELEQTYQSYMSECYDLSTVAGLALSGHSANVKSVTPPRLGVIEEQFPAVDMTGLRNFFVELFRSHHEDLMECGLDRFFDILCASFLRFLPTFIDKHPEHVTIKLLTSTAAPYNLPLRTLRRYGESIGADFKTLLILTLQFHADVEFNVANAGMTSEDGALKRSLETVCKAYTEQSQLLRTVNTQMTTMAETIASLSDCISSLKEHVRTSDTTQMTPTRKRKVSEVTSNPPTPVDDITESSHEQALTTDNSSTAFLCAYTSFQATNSMPLSDFINGLFVNNLRYNSCGNRQARSVVDNSYAYIKNFFDDKVKDFLLKAMPPVEQSEQRLAYVRERDAIANEVFIKVKETIKGKNESKKL